MAENKPTPSGKFFFDLHNFDEPEEEIIEEEIEEEPPAPTFSEEELETARAQSFYDGKQEGLKESANSREQYIAGTLDKIEQHFSKLFAQETYREKVFEEESVKLASAVLEKLFPVLNERFGREEIKDLILQTIQSQSGQGEVLIEVLPDDKDEIEKLLQKKWPDPEMAPKYKIVSKDDLEKGSCRLIWADGGMVRDSLQIANMLQKELESLTNSDSAAESSEKNDINEKDITESVPKDDKLSVQEPTDQPGEKT